MKANKIITGLRFVLIFLVISYPSLAQDAGEHGPSMERLQKIKELKAYVDSVFNHQQKIQNIPGLSYSIMVDGEVAFSNSFGIQNIEEKIAVSTSSVFRIASMTKSFTALAILKLRDEEKLLLDDPAWKYVPEMKNWEKKEITIRMLLTHMAGFPEDNPWGDRQLSMPEAQFSEFLEKEPSFSTAPGTSYEYSNLGYAILGRIISNISGISYQQYVNDNIFLPLDMNDSYWEAGEIPGNKFANGYRFINSSYLLQPAAADGAFASMGGMFTTISDFNKYMKLHLSAWSNGNDPNLIIKPSSIKEMHMPYTLTGFPGNQAGCATVSGYGYGLRWTQDCKDNISVGHSGGLPGYGSNWTILPEYGIGIVSFANRTYATLANINASMLNDIISKSGLGKKEAPVTNILAKRKEQLLEYLPSWNKSASSEVFAVNFFYDQALDELRKQTSFVFNKIGKVKKTHPLKALNNLRGSFIIEGTKSKAEVYFTLSPESSPKIQYFRIRELTQ